MGSLPAADSRSIWLKFWQFPLIAMIVAIALTVAAGYASFLLSEHVIDRWAGYPADDVLGVFGLVVICLLVYKSAIRHLGAKKHDDLPLNRAALRDTLVGFVGGGALITICVGLATLAGVYAITGPDGFGDWPRIIFVMGLYAGFFEELLLRGIVFRWLEELLGSWIALAISALAFGFLHAGNDNATFFSSLAISIEAGILLGAAYMLTRSLWLAIGLHAGWNVVQALWDVPVSGNQTEGPIAATLEGHWLLAGGGFGLEATIFALVVATSAGVWMLYKAHQIGRIVKPVWSRKGAAITAY